MAAWAWLVALLLCYSVVAHVEVVDVGADGQTSRLPPAFFRAAREHTNPPLLPTEGREGEERSAEARLVPGAYVPTFTVPVLTEEGQEGGSWTYEPSFDNSNAPLFVQAYSRNDAFLQTMWEVDFYLRDLFIETPRNCEYLFLTHESDASVTASYLYNRLQTTMTELSVNSTAIANWNSRIHIASVSVSELSNTFIPELLLQWPTTITQTFTRSSDNVRSLPGQI